MTSIKSFILCVFLTVTLANWLYLSNILLNGFCVNALVNIKIINAVEVLFIVRLCKPTNETLLLSVLQWKNTFVLICAL